MCMSSSEFEDLVYDAVERALDPREWFVEKQHSPSGSNMRMDIYVGERRRGRGIRVAIDAKHFQVKRLNQDELDSTDRYKRACRANRACFIVSQDTQYSDVIESRACLMDIDIIRANRNLSSNIRRYFEDLKYSCY